MKAARLYGPRDVRIDVVADPEPAPDQVVIRVRAVSICPSDWRMYVDGHAGGVYPDGPIIQGHEFAGDIVKLGGQVTGFSVGDRVAVEPSWPCGVCDMCREDRANLCRKVLFPSFPPQDGGLAEYVACPANCICKLPDTVSYELGALVEPLGVAIHAVRHATPLPSETVVILGAGMIGMSALMLAKLRGVTRIAVVEPVKHRHGWPASFGLGPVVCSHEELLADGFEAGVVLECSGAQESLEQATRLARPAGRIVVVGIPRDEQISFDMAVARRRELTVTFSRRSRNTLEQAIDLVASGQIDLSGLTTQAFPLQQTARALDLTGEHGQVLRAIVHP